MESKCKFYVLSIYKDKLEQLFENENIFEVSHFRETHQIIVIDENTFPSEDTIAAEDIFAVDESTWSVFIDHRPCYFSGGT